MMVLLVFSTTKIVTSQTEKAKLAGSFLTGDLCGFWNDTRWQQEFNALKDAGMQYVIIQAVADSYPERKTYTIYPSSLPNTEIAKSGGSNYPDVVDACLRNAEEAGFKVFLGIDFSNKWWELYASDSTWLYNLMNFDNNICDELWNKYKSKYPNAFYGWYWSYEIDNLHFMKPQEQKVLVTAMNIQLDHLIDMNEKLPFMWCPFMNSKVSTPEAYEKMWKNVFANLHTTEGDIFCPQDGVGAGGLKLEEVTQWYSVLRSAVNTKPGLKMWSDVETFKLYNNSFIAATINRLITQLKIENPFVDNYISWEYSYYYSPYHAHSGFHQTYLEYLASDTLETLPPTTPQNLKIKTYPGNAAVSWNASIDNVGVCGYNIYRNGKLIKLNQVPIKINKIFNSKASTYILDVNLESNTKYQYQIEAYDFAGNTSELTSAISIVTQNYDIVSNGCSYSLSQQPSNNYPDYENKKLTDGKISKQEYFTNPQWVGFSNIDSLDVVIDLKQITILHSFTANFLQDLQPSIYLPEDIKIYISNDNSNFSKVGNMVDIFPYDSLTSKHTYFLTLSDSVEARYVKFKTITKNRAWIFVDEFQIFGSIKTSVSKMKDEIEQSFNLFNNYPNPFNPTTTIEYIIPTSLPKASLRDNPSFAKGENTEGVVTLKVYDILGREVATLVNKKQPAGNYKVRFNANDLPSGIYFYRITAQGFEETKRMILLR